MKTTAPLLSVVFVLTMAGLVQGAITLRPNSILATDRTNNLIRQFDANTGAEIASLSLPWNASQTLEGITIVESQVFVNFGSTSFPTLRHLSRVDLGTGALTQVATPSAPVGLANRDSDLLAVSWGPGTAANVQRLTSAGTPISTTTLLTAGALGIGEAIDDIAWDGSNFVTVSNFRLPGAGTYDLIRWNPTTGQSQSPTFTFSYPSPGMLAEGLDANPADGALWLSINPAPGAQGPSFIERVDLSTFGRTRFQVDGTGALSDVVFVSIPAPSGITTTVGAMVLATARRRRSATLAR